MLHYLCSLSAVCEFVSVSVPFISVQHFLSCRRSNTRRRPNARLMLVHRLRRSVNISPVLGYHVVFGARLNVGQRHRRQANINPALIQSIVPVPPACQYRQHEVLTIWLNGYWTLAQHLTVIGSVSACARHQQYALPDPQPSKHEALNQCWFDACPASQTGGQKWTSIGSTSRVSWECWQAMFRTSPVWRY